MPLAFASSPIFGTLHRNFLTGDSLSALLLDDLTKKLTAQFCAKNCAVLHL
ncbi:hypothetical protein OBV_29660 [Oscillibacter valericigenes Sjm18-20]|nr:hypothetical protein OBV_29660 [Oscillibacter valericigenes Sjm18-20]